MSRAEPALAAAPAAPPSWRVLLPIPAGLDPEVVARLDAEAARRAGPDPASHPARALRAARAAQALARLHWAGAAIARAAEADPDAPPDPRWLRVEAQAARQLAAAEPRRHRSTHAATPHARPRPEKAAPPDLDGMLDEFENLSGAILGAFEARSARSRPGPAPRRPSPAGGGPAASPVPSRRGPGPTRCAR